MRLRRQTDEQTDRRTDGVHRCVKPPLELCAALWVCDKFRGVLTCGVLILPLIVEKGAINVAFVRPSVCLSVRPLRT